MWKQVIQFVADVGPITVVVGQTNEKQWGIDAVFHGIDPVIPPRKHFSSATEAQDCAIAWAQSVVSQRCAEARDCVFS
jgi:hypothetical protein